MSIKKEGFSGKQSREMIRKRLDQYGQAVNAFTQEYRTQIVQNASSGIGFQGESLDAYAASYQKLRDDFGYSTQVNMTVTGQMLKDVIPLFERKDSEAIGIIKVQPGSSSSPFGGQSALSTDKVRWTNIKRPWFGISDEARQRLTQRIREIR
jgi:hypothetical protein